MPKLDFRKTFKELYSGSPTKASVIDVPEMLYLMADGSGDPNTAPAFAAAVEELYSLSYTLKFMIRKADESLDYAVPPLEGLWWADDPLSFTAGRRDDWLWTLMIPQPPQVTPERLEEARKELERKKKATSGSARLATFHEGLSAQILHVGPYCDEGPTISRLHDFIHTNGFSLRGKHHEIYLSDPRRTAPEKLKTLIRQPVDKKQLAQAAGTETLSEDGNHARYAGDSQSH